MTLGTVPPVFGYYVNLDRPEGFFADVRNTLGKTVFEMRDTSVIDQGGMRHKRDISGLRNYLVQRGVMTPDQILLLMAA